MDEKYMVNDMLSMLKGSITTYASVITEADNQQFREKIQEMRNNCETSQYEVYCIAKQKGYYQPADAAEQMEVQKVKNQVSS